MVSAGIGATWIAILWDSSMNAGIVSYIVTAAGGDAEVSVMVNGSKTEVNVTELEPLTEYTLTVVSSSASGDMSPPSDPLTIITLARPG